MPTVQAAADPYYEQFYTNVRFQNFDWQAESSSTKKLTRLQIKLLTSGCNIESKKPSGRET